MIGFLSPKKKELNLRQSSKWVTTVIYLPYRIEPLLHVRELVYNQKATQFAYQVLLFHPLIILNSFFIYDYLYYSITFFLHKYLNMEEFIYLNNIYILLF